jgi:hypothetical protein
MNLEAQFQLHLYKQQCGEMDRDQLIEVCRMLFDQNYALQQGIKTIPDMLGAMLSDGTTETFTGSPDELDEWNALLSIIG